MWPLCGIVAKSIPVPRVLFVLQSYRSHRSSWIGYGDPTELTELLGTVRKCYRTLKSSGYCGTGVHNSYFVHDIKMIYPYPGYFWHWCTDLLEVPDTGMNVIQNFQV